jgi:hypothetical protein
MVNVGVANLDFFHVFIIIMTKWEMKSFSGLSVG